LIKVTIPKKINKRQKEILASFYEDDDKQNRKGLFDKFKDAMG